MRPSDGMLRDPRLSIKEVVGLVSSVKVADGGNDSNFTKTVDRQHHQPGPLLQSFHACRLTIAREGGGAKVSP